MHGPHIHHARRTGSNALRDDNFIFDYIRDDVNDREVLDQMYEDSIDVDEISFSSDTLPESVL